MDNEELAPIDILAFTTQELEERLLNAKGEKKASAKIVDDFLRRWYADPSMDVLRNTTIEFESDLSWFNVTEPLTMQGLRGKLVVLDFFTYCCINCMHVLPELHALEQMFPVEKGLVVVGVHSPKFENEKDGANILSAAQRYGITHPIVNDPNSKLWRMIGVRCWPSLIVVSPKGEPLLLLMGEGHGKFLEGFVEHALSYYEHNGGVETFALPLRPSSDLLPASNLRFPAKIARSPEGLLALADAGNNRILIFNMHGVVLYKIGGKTAGFMDGGFELARFNSPQGVTFLTNDTLVVADTENHAVRQITLSSGIVETLAGNGKQGNDRTGGKVGTQQEISSPWDVAVFYTRDMDMSFHVDERKVQEKPIILVAMSGTHQIWGYFPEGIIWWKFRKFEPRICVSIIGNGLEENRNNSYPQNAAFAQPSGLAMSKDALFIADSESSSIRKVSMVDGKVTGLVGGDRNPLNLFAFGDVDGKQYNAKLQHPLGVTYNAANDRVYVADTYNHKIKVIDPTTSTIETLAITDDDGSKYQFNEPAGVCFNAVGDQLLVADTNNHCLRLVDLRTLSSKPFPLDFNRMQLDSETDSASGSGDQVVKICPLHSYKQLNLNVAIALEESLQFTSDAPQKWQLTSPSFQTAATSGQVDGHGKFTVQLKATKPTAAGTTEFVKLDVALSLCDKNSCHMKRFVIVLNDAAGGSELASAGRETVANVGVNVYVTKKGITMQQ